MLALPFIVQRGKQSLEFRMFLSMPVLIVGTAINGFVELGGECFSQVSQLLESKGIHRIPHLIEFGHFLKFSFGHPLLFFWMRQRLH